MLQPMHKRERFNQVSNFAVLYGREGTHELINYDAVIVEPQACEEETLHELKRQNTLVMGYVSVMEVARFHPDFQYLSDYDFLQLGGQPLKNQTFQTWLVDLESQRWQSLLHHQIGYLIRVVGYDGVFLDTIGDVEFPQISGTKRISLIEAALAFVRSVRESFPEAVLIQNNGLEVLVDKTAAYLDAVCWENPPHAVEDPWVTNISSKLRRYSESGLRTLLLSDNQAATKHLEELHTRIPGSMTYHAGVDYLSFGTQHNRL